MTGADRYRAIYLNDHLMASTAGLALVRRAARENAGTQLGRVLAGLATEIAADRTELLDVMAGLGIARSRPKEIAGAVAERLTRLKRNGRLVRYSPLSRMLELETLSVGITGKLELWEALAQAAGDDDRLDATRLREHALRARAQRELLEPWRLASARQALGGGAGVER